MQVSVENVGSLGRKLTVRIPAARLEDTIRTRIQDLGRNARLKGFRPGKVPTKVIEQRYGAQIRGEALSELIGSSFQEAVAQEKLRPAVQPSIATSGKPENGEIEYTATFEVMPEVGRIDVSALDIVKPVAAVSEADVEQMIETLRQQRRGWTPVERASQNGDMMLFEYSVQGTDFRHPAEGAERVGTILGSEAMSKALEDRLVGHKSGDSVDAEVDFPGDFRVTALAGRHGQVAAKVARVQEPHLPAVDEAFAAGFGVKDGGIARFREDVRANLERELKSALLARLKAATVEKLVDAHPELELPQGMIENEARNMAQQGEGRPALPHEQFLPMARKRVAAGVLLAEIARQNGVKLDPVRVREALAGIASTYEEPEQVVELYTRDPQLMGALQSRVLEDQVIDWIAEHARATEQHLSFNELMRPGV